MQLPRSVIDEAILLRRRKKVGGIKHEAKALLAASVLAAARQRKIPVTIKEIAKATGLKENEIYRALQELSVKLRVIDPKALVQGTVAKLPIAPEEKAKLIYEALRRLQAGRRRGNPRVQAASAIYAAAQELGLKVSQRKVAQAATVSDCSVRNRYKEFLQR
ncbi:MAG: hypothetical protein DRJ97_04350 [Thermoprotei archaeon]|nr:MAG: hypothetical protein DRJ97_04350 [Thermoprotei archaeon]